jgi:phosphate butyryltransferase
MGADLTGIGVIDIAGDAAAAERACALVHEGRTAAVMKGHLHTDDLLRAMLDKTNGLRIGRRFTHVFVMDVPGQPEPIFVTDAAINIAPDLPTKMDICQNAIDLARSLGMDPRAIAFGRGWILRSRRTILRVCVFGRRGVWGGPFAGC